jgi:hypothetical protein
VMTAEPIPEHVLVGFDRQGKNLLTIIKPRPDKKEDPPREVPEELDRRGDPAGVAANWRRSWASPRTRGSASRASTPAPRRPRATSRWATSSCR